MKISPFPYLQVIQIETAQVSAISETKSKGDQKEEKTFQFFPGVDSRLAPKFHPATTRPRLGVLDPDPSLRGETYRTWPNRSGGWWAIFYRGNRIRFFHDASSVRYKKVACDNRKQKSYRVNRPLRASLRKRFEPIQIFKALTAGCDVSFCV